jgi:hypothetical protein
MFSGGEEAEVHFARHIGQCAILSLVDRMAPRSATTALTSLAAECDGLRRARTAFCGSRLRQTNWSKCELAKRASELQPVICDHMNAKSATVNREFFTSGQDPD